MDDSLQRYGWFILITLFLVMYMCSLMWQALLYKVWGNRVLSSIFTGRALYLKTKEGEYRVDKVHQKFNYKLKEDVAWSSVDYAEIANIYLDYSNDSANLIEFLVGDWNIFDLYAKNRDSVNTWTIRIRFRGSGSVPIFSLKQYEQRDWFIGQLYLNIAVAILRRINLYRDGEAVAEERATWIIENFKRCSLDTYIK